MGFFRRIFGAKKSSDPPEGKEKRHKKKWSFSNKSRKTSSQQTSNNKNPNNGCSSSVSATGNASQFDGDDSLDANKHAIAVAAATAAVAEAALAAAKAAAEVVRLTTGTASGSSQLCGNHRRLDEFSALKIQSAFRGYLARRALRALKALVKLQALVRGHIVRKQTADMLRRMQTLVRLQARARAGRAHSSESLQSGSQSSLPRRLRCGSNTNLAEFVNQDEVQSGWFDYWVEENIQNQKNTPFRNGLADDEKSDKILEVDTWKPQLNPENNRNTYNTTYQAYVSDYSNQSHLTFDSPSKSSRRSPYLNPSISSGEVLSSSSVKPLVGKEEMATRIAEDSPQLYPASSRPGSSARRGPFTPARSECSWGYFSGYSTHPNYMANTESSRAKVRSQSAPRQRLEFEKYGTTRRFVQRSWDADTSSEKGFYLRSDVRKNAYPALNRLGSSKLR